MIAIFELNIGQLEGRFSSSSIGDVDWNENRFGTKVDDGWNFHNGGALFVKFDELRWDVQ